MGYFIVILSFILEFILVNLIVDLGYFNPQFLLVSLVLLQLFFIIRGKYNCFIFIISILYGTIYLNNIALGVFLIYSSYMLLGKLNSLFKPNVQVIFFEIILIIVFYNLLMYLVLLLSGYGFFDIGMIITIIFESLILNIIYGLTIYLIIKYCSKFI